MIFPRKALLTLLAGLTLLWIFTGCSGNTLTDDQRAVTATQLLEQGWNSFASANYTAAIKTFENVLIQPLLTDDQKREAHNGIGWTLTRQGQVLESIPHFEHALGNSDKRSDSEARVGLAAAKVQRHAGKQDFLDAVDLITGIDRGNADFVFTPNPAHPVQLNSARAHALLAIAYAFAGDAPNATSQKFKAGALDANTINTSVDLVVEALGRLGF